VEREGVGFEMRVEMGNFVAAWDLRREIWGTGMWVSIFRIHGILIVRC